MTRLPDPDRRRGRRALTPARSLLRREGADHLELFTGTVARRTGWPRSAAGRRAGPRSKLACSVRSATRAACVDDDALECLEISGQERTGLAERQLPRRAGGDRRRRLRHQRRGVRRHQRVLHEEICRGEAPIVIHRTTGHRAGPPLQAALRRCVGCWRVSAARTGPSWCTPAADHGHEPRGHVSVDDGLRMMNRISGTPGTSAGRPSGRAGASSPTRRRSTSCTWCSTRS
jgi:phenazine biosynthesis protein phzE